MWTRIPDPYGVNLSCLGFTTIYKTAGTAKIRESLGRQLSLWVGEWVGDNHGKTETDQAGALPKGRVRSKFWVGQEVKKDVLVEEVAL